MGHKQVVQYTMYLLIFQIIAASAALYAAQPCIGLMCQGSPLYDARQIASHNTPKHVSIDMVVSHPGDYDGRNIQLTGRIISIEQSASRRGNMYLVFTIMNVNSPTNTPGDTLRIFAFSWPRLEPGDTIAVHGTYRVDYWFGGFPFENFIYAEQIKRESVI